jgi:hypothetical protein
MNEHPLRRAGAPRGFELLRWVDGVELPIAGEWTVRGPHDAVYFTRVRPGRSDQRFPARLEHATVLVADDADDVTLTADLHVPNELARRWLSRPVGTRVRLVVRSVPDPHRWTVAGSAHSGDVSMPALATLHYHGVWRHGDCPYGWYGLSGTIADPSGHARDELRISCDLMAYGPTPAHHGVAA